MGMMDRIRMMIMPTPGPSVDNFWPFVNFNGGSYPLGLNQSLLGKEERPDPGYPGLVGWAYQTNAVVYACEQARVQLFSEASFEWESYAGRRFTDKGLAILETPWPNAVTSDLLMGMLLDADLGTDSFTVRLDGTLARLRPDWTTVVTDLDPWMPGSRIIGYAYTPGGPQSKPIMFLREQVAHFKTSPDPLSPHRGMSWLTPVIREISADIGMTEHKRAFLVNGATPNLVISLDPAISKAAFDQWVAAFQGNHRGTRNAYETMFLGGGAKAEVVGKDLQQLDFKLVQGAGETRIAAAAGVPPVIVGLSEGLQAATYSNYSQARRRFADGTMRPLWRNACGSLQTILNAPGGAELTIDDSDIAFLQDDMKDRAEIQSTNAAAIGQLVKDGFTPESAVLAITANDLTQLVHTGLYSVQLQPPMPEQPEPEPEPTEPEEEEPEDDAEPVETETGRALSEALGIIRARFDREQPAPTFNNYVTTPEVVVPITVEPATVNVTTPEITVEPTPVEITVSPTPVEITNEVSVEPIPVEINITVDTTPEVAGEAEEEPADG